MKRILPALLLLSGSVAAADDGIAFNCDSCTAEQMRIKALDYAPTANCSYPNGQFNEQMVCVESTRDVLAVDTVNRAHRLYTVTRGAHLPELSIQEVPLLASDVSRINTGIDGYRALWQIYEEAEFMMGGASLHAPRTAVTGGDDADTTTCQGGSTTHSDKVESPLDYMSDVKYAGATDLMLADYFDEQLAKHQVSWSEYTNSFSFQVKDAGFSLNSGSGATIGSGLQVSFRGSQPNGKNFVTLSFDWSATTRLVLKVDSHAPGIYEFTPMVKSSLLAAVRLDKLINPSVNVEVNDCVAGELAEYAERHGNSKSTMYSDSSVYGGVYMNDLPFAGRIGTPTGTYTICYEVWKWTNSVNNSVHYTVKWC